MKKGFLLLLTGALILVCISYVSYENYRHRPYHFKDKVAVITYHHIDPQETDYTVSPDRFRDHLQALQNQNYHVISIENFHEFLQGRFKVPDNAVVITFDDGYDSFYRYAYPELKKRGLLATDFVIASYVGRPGFLTWGEMEQMKKDGFGLYSHTYNLHSTVTDNEGHEVNPLTNQIYLADRKRMETEAEYDVRVKGDLLTAETTLREHLDNRLSMLCFPHGEYTPKVIELGKQAGIDTFFTGAMGLNSRGDSMIRRINAGTPHMTGDKLTRLLSVQDPPFHRIKKFIKGLLNSKSTSEM
jgi:biofilm PGA synthesis lipoprotein PgaB